MPAYVRGELSVEAYLVRIIAALCHQSGGTLRVKGELVDTIGEATALLKSWDSKTQELVLTVNMGSFGEVFKVIPEKQSSKQQVLFTPQPIVEGEPSATEPNRHGSTIDDPERIVNLEKRLRKVRFAAGLKDTIARS
jgi:hypothetical protein